MKKPSAVTLSIFSGLLVLSAVTPHFLGKGMDNGRSPANQEQESEEKTAVVEEKKDEVVCEKESSEDLEKKMQKLLDDKIAVLYEEEEYRNYKVEQRKIEKNKKSKREKKAKEETVLEEVALSQPSPSTDPTLMLMLQQMTSMTSMMSSMINSQQKMMDQMFSLLGPPSIQSFNRQPSLFDDSFALSTLLLSQRVGTGLQNPYGTPSPYYERMPAQIEYRETYNQGPHSHDGYNMAPGSNRDFSRGSIFN